MSKLLKPVEAAEKLRISRRTLDREIAAGHLPTVRIGKRAVRVDEATLDQYIASGGSREEAR